MKIRWTENGVRFRITPPELARVEAGDLVTEALELPGGAWRATIVAGSETGIRLENNALRLTLGPVDRTRLAAADVEGVYFQTSGDRPVRYYIEKDFPCAHPRPAGAAEPTSETFAPPPGFQERHQTGP